jgi:hypothetical protein
MATALGAGIGATIAAAKAAPSEKENQGGHRALSPNQFGKKK